MVQGSVAWARGQEHGDVDWHIQRSSEGPYGREAHAFYEVGYQLHLRYEKVPLRGWARPNQDCISPYGSGWNPTWPYRCLRPGLRERRKGRDHHTSQKKTSRTLGSQRDAKGAVEGQLEWLPDRITANAETGSRQK